jgi:hypothetical protein
MQAKMRESGTLIPKNNSNNVTMIGAKYITGRQPVHDTSLP